MLILYTSAHDKLCALTNYSDLYVEGVVSGTGSSDNITLPQLHFKYPLEDPQNGKIALECYIALATDDGRDDAEYIVKEHNLKTEKNGGITWVEYVCDLNIEPLKGTPIDNFAPGSVPPDEAVNLALAGTGWKVGYCDVTRRRNAAKTYCMVFDAIKDVAKAYACEITFDSINHTVDIHQKQGADRGVYFAEQINLKSLEVQANSRNYVTNLYPRGKDGLTISDVNGGVPYISNYQYSTKVIGAYWIDNRYTNAADLLADATERLDYLSKPTQAYAAEIIDLARASDDKWGLLDFRLGDWITIISESAGVREQQRIVKIDRYPDEPEKSTCELANRLASLDDIILRVSDAADAVDAATDSAGMVQGSAVQVTNPDGTYSNLNAVTAKVGSLIATKADITDLTAASGRIDNLVSTKADITYLQANYLTADSVKATYATITNLQANYATITNVQSTYATIDSLSAATADINKLKTDKLDAATAAITYATVSSLTATNGNITNLQSDSAKIINLLSDNAGIGSLSAGTVSVNYAALMHGQLGDAQIGSLSVARLLAGIVSTDKFTVQSDSGNLSISKNTMHVYDANGKERVTVGLNGSDYNLTVRAADGQTTIFGASGVTHAGITDGAVDDSKVATGANINGSKIDQESLVSRINGASTLLNSSRVKYDPTGQTLTAEFQSLSGTVSGQGSTLSAQGTSISTIQGQITNKVWETDITSAVNGIQVGGRNLIRGTNNTTYWNNCNGTCQVVHDADINDFCLEITTTGDGIWIPLTVKAISGEKHSWSVWLKADKSVTVDVGGEDGGEVSCNLTTTWQLFKFEGFTSNGNCSGNTHVYYSDTSAHVRVYHFKRELGTKVTDWTPAPEDVQSQIDTHSSEISQNTSDISLRVLSSTYNNYVSSNNSNVSDLQSRMSTAEQKITPEAITYTVASNITGNQIVSVLNQTATTFSIDASKINLNGFVTLTQLSTPGATTISGSNIDTSTLKVNKVYNATDSAYGTIGTFVYNDGANTNTYNGLELYGDQGFMGAVYGLRYNQDGNTDQQSYISLQTEKSPSAQKWAGSEVTAFKDVCLDTNGTITSIRSEVNILASSYQASDNTSPSAGIHVLSNGLGSIYSEIDLETFDKGGYEIGLKINQNGIIPVGALISGVYKYVSNFNGEAWEFEDGLMICTAVRDVTTDSDGYLYWNFPVIFVSSLDLFVSPMSALIGPAGEAYLAGSVISYIDNTGVRYRFIYTHDGSPASSSTIYGVRFCAIGRWKN